MSKHTPGKWLHIHREWDDSDTVCNSRGACVAVRPRFVSAEDWKPDARLLAAAPDLLEALKNLVLLCELDGCSRDLPEYVAAKAAINAAEGGAK